jgi:thioredoxin-dependent peroxiredoxin
MSFLKNLFGKKAENIALNKPAPVFSLPDENGNIISLSEFEGKNDVMLCFIRGDFCPFCQIMLKTFQSEREKFIQKNVVMLSVSPGPVDVNHGIVKKFGLDYKLLCDDTQKVMQQYDCHDPSDTRAYPEGMPVPGTFLIDKAGILRFYSRADKAEEAFNPSAILKALETLS